MLAVNVHDRPGQVRSRPPAIAMVVLAMMLGARFFLVKGQEAAQARTAGTTLKDCFFLILKGMKGLITGVLCIDDPQSGLY
jgi:hypothetical protein